MENKLFVVAEVDSALLFQDFSSPYLDPFCFLSLPTPPNCRHPADALITAASLSFFYMQIAAKAHNKRIMIVNYIEKS